VATIRRTGLPSDVAARYRAPMAFIDSTAARRLIRAGWIGAAVIAAAGLADDVTRPGFSERPFQPAQACWTGTLLLTLCWLGAAGGRRDGRHRRSSSPAGGCVDAATPPPGRQRSRQQVGLWLRDRRDDGRIVVLSDPSC
jgi:hypothetical protein